MAAKETNPTEKELPNSLKSVNGGSGPNPAVMDGSCYHPSGLLHVVISCELATLVQLFRSFRQYCILSQEIGLRRQDMSHRPTLEITGMLLDQMERRMLRSYEFSKLPDRDGLGLVLTMGGQTRDGNMPATT